MDTMTLAPTARRSRTPRRLLSALAGAAVVAGSLTAVAPATHAAVGDVTAYSLPLTAVDITTSGANAWALSTDFNQNTSRLTRIAPDGSLVTVNLTGLAQKLTTGPDGNIWVAGRDAKAIYRVDNSLNVTSFTNGMPANADPYDITVGPDGALWFTMVTTKQIGRITTDGVITSFSTGTQLPRTIGAGPTGSNAVYYGLNGNSIGRMSTSGQQTTINAQSTTAFTDGPVVAGSVVWFIERGGPNVNDNLARIVNDQSSVAIVTQGITTMGGTAPGIGDTFWVAATAQRKAVQFSKEGAQLKEYALALPPSSIYQSPTDGSVWLTAGTQALKLNVGVVPISSKAPEITPSTGIAAGTTLSTSNGEWSYATGATYTYRWQLCSSSDPNSCGDTANNTAQTYVVSSAEIGKYMRSCVLATNANGAAAAAACSAPLALGSAAPAPTPPAPPAPATTATASIGNGATMTLDAPAKQKRGKRGTYDLAFSVVDAKGMVTLTFAGGAKTAKATVAISAGDAVYRWKAPKKWPTGITTVTATFTPATGSPYQAASVKDTVRVR